MNGWHWPRCSRTGPIASRRTRYVRAQVRRVFAAVLVGVAAFAALTVLRPETTDSGIPVLVADRALAAGSLVTRADVGQVRMPHTLVPASAVLDWADLDGAVLAGPMSAGEPFTTARLQGPGLLAGAPPGTVAVAVPLADPAILPSLRPGDRIRVLAVGTGAVVADGTVLVAEPGGVDGLGLASAHETTARLLAAVDDRAAASMAAAGGPAGVSGGFLVALLAPAHADG